MGRGKGYIKLAGRWGYTKRGGGEQRGYTKRAGGRGILSLRGDGGYTKRGGGGGRGVY